MNFWSSRPDRMERRCLRKGGAHRSRLVRTRDTWTSITANVDWPWVLGLTRWMCQVVAIRQKLIRSGQNVKKITKRAKHWKGLLLQTWRFDQINKLWQYFGHNFALGPTYLRPVLFACSANTKTWAAFQYLASQACRPDQIRFRWRWHFTVNSLHLQDARESLTLERPSLRWWVYIASSSPKSLCRAH